MHIKDTKNVLGAEKMTFFGIHFFDAHLHVETNFFVFTKISYLQPFREIMGVQNSVTTNKQLTNEHHGR